MGFTGKNITTAIMDDGVDYTHPDLMNNFVNLILYSKIEFKKKIPLIAKTFRISYFLFTNSVI